MPLSLPAATLGSGIVGGATSLLGGVLGAWSQNQANKTQLQIAREQNALNYKMFQEQNAFNLDQWNRSANWNLAQWNRENAYNSPAAQRARLQAAGYNPALLEGASPSAAGALQVNPARSAEWSGAAGAQVHPMDFSAIANAGSIAADTALKMSQVRKTEKESVHQDLENQFYVQMTAATLRNMGLDAQAKILENEYNSQTLNNRVELSDASLSDALLHLNLTNENIKEVEIRNKIAQAYGMKTAEQNYRQVMAMVEKLKQEKKTAISAEMLNNATTNRVKNATALDSLRYILERELNEANVRNVNADTAFKNEQREKTRDERVGLGYDNAMKYEDLLFKSGLNEAELQQRVLNHELTREQITNLMEQYNLTHKEVDYYEFEHLLLNAAQKGASALQMLLMAK